MLLMKIQIWNQTQSGLMIQICWAKTKKILNSAKEYF